MLWLLLYDRLPVNLERGPTPITPSFKQLHTPIPIVGVTAGAQADTVYQSYDDNELSDWMNKGNLSTARFEYEPEHAATVGETCLKLNNFCSRSYPLRIMVDGKEVFNGITPRSLG